MKRKISLLLALVMVLSLTAYAAIETPIIPVSPIENTKVTLTSDADSPVLAGTAVEFTTKIEGISKSNGITSGHFSYDYSDGLEFAGDVYLSGAPGWTVSGITDENNTLSFDIEGEEITSTFAVRFTFNVAVAPTSRQSVKLDTASLYDTKSNRVVVTKNSSNNSFSVESVVPDFDNLGASVRINNEPAIRFGMRVEKDDVYKKAFGSGSYSYSSSDKIKFGMLCIAKDALDGVLTIDTKGVYVKNFKETFIDNSNELVFVYEIDPIGSKTYSYATRPFISYELDNGEVVYFYGVTKTRNAEYVAQTELKSETDAAKKELLNKFINE